MILQKIATAPYRLGACLGPTNLKGPCVGPRMLLQHSVDGLVLATLLLTKPWRTDALQGMSVGEFVGNWVSRDAVTAASPTLFLWTEDARQCTLLEDRSAWDEGNDPRGSVFEDISPVRGSLVLF
jgi:hypothetical protein